MPEPDEADEEMAARAAKRQEEQLVRAREARERLPRSRSTDPSASLPESKRGSPAADEHASTSDLLKARRKARSEREEPPA